MDKAKLDQKTGTSADIIKMETTSKSKDKKVDAEKIAEVLSQMPSKGREVIINQMNAALITFRALEPYLKAEAKPNEHT